MGAACAVGASIALAGLALGSPAVLRFIAAHASRDGILDPYTIWKIRDLALKLSAAGILVPAAALLGTLLIAPGRVCRRVFAWAALAAVAAGYCAAVDIGPHHAARMRSKPDEIQYAVPALNLLALGRPVMVMNGREYPPITPLGFQCVLAACYRVVGTMIGNGIRAVQAGAVLSIIGVYLLGTSVRGRVRGLLAALLLAANPCFIFWTQGIMPSTVILALTIAAGLVLCRMARGEGAASGTGGAALLGLLTGALLLLSFSHVFVAPATFFAMLYASRTRGRAGARALAFCLAAFAVVLPQLLYQHAAYGGFLTTGYYSWFWTSAPGEGVNLPLSWQRRTYDVLLLEILGKLGFDARVNSLGVILLDVLGVGALYNISVFALFVVGLAAVRRRNAGRAYGSLLLFLGLFAALNTPAYAFTYLEATRHFLQAVPFVLIVCADGFCDAFERRDGACVSRRIAVCVCLAFSCSSAMDLARGPFQNAAEPPNMYDIARGYEEIAEGGSLVVSGIPGAYLSVFIPAGRNVLWLPFAKDKRLTIKDGRPLVPGAGEGIDLVTRCVAAGRTVYLDDWGEARYPAEYRRIRERFACAPVRKGNGWEIVRLREKEPPPSR